MGVIPYIIADLQYEQKITVLRIDPLFQIMDGVGR